MANTPDQQRKLRLATTALTVADAPALTATVAATNPPTKVEFDKVVADNVALRTAHQNLLVALRTAGIVDP